MLTEFQIACERRISESLSIPLTDRMVHPDGEGGHMVEARLGPATIWIYADVADGVQWHLGKRSGFFERWDYKNSDLLLEAFVADLEVIAATGEAPTHR